MISGITLGSNYQESDVRGKFLAKEILSERLDFVVENVRGWRGSFVDRCIDIVDNVLQEKERSGGHFVVTYILAK